MSAARITSAGIGLIPTAAAVQSEPVESQSAQQQDTGDATEQSVQREPRARSAHLVLAYVLTGLHLGVLQTSLFFAAQVYVTATFLGYFVVVMAWMAGTIVSMKTGFPRSLPGALGASVAAYVGLILLASGVVPEPWMYPFYFLLAMIAALPAGTFFREFARCGSSRALFFHENNGFVLGLLLGMFGFVHWGVNFLAVAPLLSLAGALVVYVQPWIALLVFIPGAIFLCVRLGNDWAAWTVGLAGGLGAIAWATSWWLLRRESEPGRQRRRVVKNAIHEGKPTGLPLPRVVLALAGANLILLQYFITREFSSILAASELAILVVAIAYFAGFSVGYAISRSIPLWLLRWGGVAMFAIHLSMLMFVKVLAGLLIDAGFGMTALVGLLFLASFVTSSFYSILLPRVIDSLRIPLVSGYSWDLAGAITGTVFMLLLVPLAPQVLWPAYFAVMLGIIVLLHWRSPVRVVIGVLGVGMILGLSVYQGPIQRLASEDYYRTRGYDHPELLFGGNSFYHSIDVLRTYADAEQTRPTSRVSFINGVRYFRHYVNSDGTPAREASLSEFTYFLAALPARSLSEELGRPLRILIMGGGSLSTLSRVAPYSHKTTLVEIDALVVKSAKENWSDINRWREVQNAEIVIDDARHYLRTTDESFDLIINDISAPYYLGTAIMHSVELYELVRSKLARGGLFSESTQSRPIPSRPDRQAMKILRGVATVFPHWRVVDGESSPRGRHGYVYATVDGTLSTKRLTAIMKRDDTYAGTSTYWEGTDRFALHRSTPFSLNNMDTLLTSNIGRITRRLGLDDDDAGTQRSSLVSVLGDALDASNENHSRLLVASRAALSDRRLLIPAAIFVLLAAGLRWFSLLGAGVRSRASAGQD